jgi:hypothetical protein
MIIHFLYCKKQIRLQFCIHVCAREPIKKKFTPKITFHCDPKHEYFFGMIKDLIQQIILLKNRPTQPETHFLIGEMR